MKKTLFVTKEEYVRIHSLCRRINDKSISSVIRKVYKTQYESLMRRIKSRQ